MSIGVFRFAIAIHLSWTCRRDLHYVKKSVEPFSNPKFKSSSLVISTSSLSLMLLLFLKYHHLSWKNYFPHDFHSFTLVQVFIGGMVCVPRNLGLGLLLLQTGSASALRRRRRRRHKVEGQKSVALEKFIIIWQKLEKVAA